MVSGSAVRTVLAARLLWPVLRRAAALLREEGYRVEQAPAWDRLLDSGLACEALAGVLLGEAGEARREAEILRRFREREAALGVPVAVVGGMNARRHAAALEAAGADLVLPADLPPEEVVSRLRPLFRYGSLVRALREESRGLRERSLRDDLTGLPNRRHFSLDLARCLELARRSGRPVSCILIDVDDFRKVNETYGEGAGDGVIREIARRLEKTARRYDAVARLGADEFGWLLVDADADRAMSAARRAHDLVCGQPFEAAAEPLRLTATLGVSTALPGADLPACDLVGNADRALYWGKETGKNAVRFYPPREAQDDGTAHSHLS